MLFITASNGFAIAKPIHILCNDLFDEARKGKYKEHLPSNENKGIIHDDKEAFIDEEYLKISKDNANTQNSSKKRSLEEIEGGEEEIDNDNNQIISKKQKIEHEEIATQRLYKNNDDFDLYPYSYENLEVNIKPSGQINYDEIL
jgi:hypothetical protein